VLLVDTGVLVAATIVDDPDSEACIRLLKQRHDRVVSCLPVLTEAVYLVRSARPNAAAGFVRNVVASEIELEQVAGADLARVAELLDQYADLRLDFTDAVLIALAERLGVTEIATLDRRDFSVVRPRHVDAFTLLP
jgi:predicted nucleic acid-binding protein